MKSIRWMILAGMWSGVTHAELVSQEFSGLLNNDVSLSESFREEFPAGTKWTLQVEWDDAQSPIFLSDTQSQWATTKYTLTLDGVSGPWICSALEGKSSVGLNEFGSTDEIQFTSSWGPENHSQPDMAGYPVYSINLVFTDSSGAALDGVAQLPSQIDLSRWMLNISELKIYVSQAGFPVIKGSIDGEVTTQEENAKTVVLSSGESLESNSIVSMGKTKIGGKAVRRVLVIRNEGTKEMVNLKALVRGKHRKDFRVRGLSASSLAPSAEQRVKIDFQPRKNGVRKALLKVSSNDPESPFLIRLKGRGLAG